jgi:hypothetical protein
MPMTSAITMPGIGAKPLRSRAVATATIATADDSNKPGTIGPMSARLRRHDVLKDVNGRLSRARRGENSLFTAD